MIRKGLIRAVCTAQKESNKTKHINILPGQASKLLLLSPRNSTFTAGKASGPSQLHAAAKKKGGLAGTFGGGTWWDASPKQNHTQNHQWFQKLETLIGLNT